MEFFSSALTGSKRNYTANKFVMYAVVRAVEHFEIVCSALSFYSKQITRRCGIYYDEIYLQLLESNGGSCAFFNLPSKLNIRAVRIISSLTCCPTYPLQQRRKTTNRSPSTSLLVRFHLVRLTSSPLITSVPTTPNPCQ